MANRCLRFIEVDMRRISSMKATNGRLTLLLVGSAIILALFLLFMPVPIAGCYTFSDVTTAGHNFLHFEDGQVTYVREYATNRSFGSYSFVKGEGWIWIDSGTSRRILVRPGIFSIKFDPADGIDRVPKYPIEMRVWNFRKNAEILKRSSTNNNLNP